MDRSCNIQKKEDRWRNMLTKEQIKKLRPLIKDPKFGKLLSAAISGWKRTKPIRCKLGIDEKFKRSKYEEGCCLIGASLVNRKPKEETFQLFELVENEILRRFGIDSVGQTSIMNGFDGFAYHTTNDREAYMFGQTVKKIVLC